MKLKSLLVTESKVLIPSKQVPRAVREWVKETLGKDIQKYSLFQGEKVSIGTPWHEADREYYQAFKLLPGGDAELYDKTAFRSGWEGEAGSKPGWSDEMLAVPDGFMVVMAGIYPMRAEIYTSKNVQQLLPDTETVVTDIEALALQAAVSLISSARPKFSNEIYTNLILKGLMKANKSITLKGRNLISSKAVQDQIQQAKSAVETKLGHSIF
jgi:hypothetical protein